MDNQNNQWEQPQSNPVETEQNEKKRGSMGLGFFFGALAGCVGIVMILLVIVIGYCGITGNRIVLGPKSTASGEEVSGSVLDKDTMEKIMELSAYINVYFYDEYEADDIRDGIYHGMVSALGDKYSAYYTAEEYEELQIDTNGTYYGIGATLTQEVDTMQVSIVRVYEGTPAEEAGLKKDDIILYVNDIEAVSMELSPLVQNIRGEEGTTVHLQVYRPSSAETLEFDVERRYVELPTVTRQMLENNIGYIELTAFQDNTAEQFEKTLAELEAQGMEAMIIDVRGNLGGLVSSVVRILDDLLPEGTVVYTEDKYGNRKDYTSDSSCVDYPIVVLTDQNTASASEILAGAIKDYDYGTLIGTTTFGKGIVQSIIPLEEGDAIKLTTEKYFTPSGVNIHGTGIEPDIELEYEFLGPEDAEYEIAYDNQIQKAIEILQEELMETN